MHIPQDLDMNDAKHVKEEDLSTASPQDVGPHQSTWFQASKGTTSERTMSQQGSEYSEHREHIRQPRYPLLDFFFPIPSLSTVPSLHTTFCRLTGPPLNLRTPTEAGLPAPAPVSDDPEGPAPVSDVGVPVVVSVREPWLACWVFGRKDVDIEYGTSPTCGYESAGR
jgi:hypothetical protein